MAKTTDELFAEATEADYETAEPVTLAASDTEEEFQFRIDEHLRTIAIPEKGVVAGVEGDLNVNIARFTMTRYYHGRDLSKLNIRINYRNANGQVNYYTVSDATASGDSIIFSWEFAADVTQYKGNVQFVVYLFSATNAVLKQRFFTTLGTLEVLEGLEVDSSIPVSEQTDILLHLKKDLSAYAEEVKKSLPADYTAMTEQVSSLKEDIDNYAIEESSNLFNGQFIVGQFINPSTGNISPNASWGYYNEYISVPFESYLTFSVDNIDIEINVAVVCYDENKQRNDNYGTRKLNNSSKSFTIINDSEQVKYFRFEIQNVYDFVNGKYHLQVEYGKNATKYHPKIISKHTLKIEEIEENIKNIDDKIQDLESYKNPQYIENMVETIKTKLYKVQNSNSITFAFPTDIHDVAYSTTDAVISNIIKRFCYALNDISKKQRINACILGGDYLWNSLNSSTKKICKETYSRLRDSLRVLTIPLIVGKGNHDDNSIVLDGNTLGISEILSNEEIYNDFSCISSEDKVTMNYGEIDKSYGFLDIKNRKIRIFFLNTVDIPNSLPKYTQQHTKAIGQKQLDFVANNLHFNSNDWGVIFISHHCLYNNSGINPSNDKDTYVTDSHGGDAIKGIINAFKNRTSYSVNSTLENFGYSLNIDFTDNKSNEVICCINGHTHKDAHGITDNGILLISSQNAGIQDGEDENGNPVSKTKGTETETAIDIFTIDRKIKKVFATRYGAGKDREFNY